MQNGLSGAAGQAAPPNPGEAEVPKKVPRRVRPYGSSPGGTSPRILATHTVPSLSVERLGDCQQPFALPVILTQASKAGRGSAVNRVVAEPWGLPLGEAAWNMLWCRRYRRACHRTNGCS